MPEAIKIKTTVGLKNDVHKKYPNSDFVNGYLKGLLKQTRVPIKQLYKIVH